MFRLFLVSMMAAAMLALPLDMPTQEPPPAEVEISDSSEDAMEPEEAARPKFYVQSDSSVNIDGESRSVKRTFDDGSDEVIIKKNGEVLEKVTESTPFEADEEGNLDARVASDTSMEWRKNETASDFKANLNYSSVVNEDERRIQATQDNDEVQYVTLKNGEVSATNMGPEEVEEAMAEPEQEEMDAEPVRDGESRDDWVGEAPEYEEEGERRISDGEPGSMPETDEEGMPESDLDRMPESDLDRMPESDMDRMPESDVDRMPESDMDTMPESDMDRMPESDVDRMPETEEEGMPESDPSSMLQIDPDSMPEGEYEGMPRSENESVSEGDSHTFMGNGDESRLIDDDPELSPAEKAEVIRNFLASIAEVQRIFAPLMRHSFIFESEGRDILWAPSGKTGSLIDSSDSRDILTRHPVPEESEYQDTDALDRFLQETGGEIIM